METFSSVLRFGVQSANHWPTTLSRSLAWLNHQELSDHGSLCSTEIYNYKELKGCEVYFPYKSNPVVKSQNNLHFVLDHVFDCSL